MSRVCHAQPRMERSRLRIDALVHQQARRNAGELLPPLYNPGVRPDLKSAAMSLMGEPSATTSAVTLNCSASRMAGECRDLWRIGRTAVPDLALAVESAGVVLIREETGISQIEGLSAWSDALGVRWSCSRPTKITATEAASTWRTNSAT